MSTSLMPCKAPTMVMQHVYFRVVHTTFIYTKRRPGSRKPKYLRNTQDTHPCTPQPHEDGDHIDNKQHRGAQHPPRAENTVQHEMSPQMTGPHCCGQVNDRVEQDMRSDCLSNRAEQTLLLGIDFP